MRHDNQPKRGRLMRRLWLALLLVATAACGDVSPTEERVSASVDTVVASIAATPIMFNADADNSAQVEHRARHLAIERWYANAKQAEIERAAEAARLAAEKAARQEAARRAAAEAAAQASTAVAVAEVPPEAPVQATGPCGGWEDLIATYFPGETGKACRVMMCESGGDPTIHNSSSSASGLWQFLDSTWESVTGTPAPAANYSAETQTAAAARLRNSSGWGQWSCK